MAEGVAAYGFDVLKFLCVERVWVGDLGTEGEVWGLWGWGCVSHGGGWGDEV